MDLFVRRAAAAFAETRPESTLLALNIKPDEAPEVGEIVYLGDGERALVVKRERFYRHVEAIRLARDAAGNNIRDQHGIVVSETIRAGEAHMILVVANPPEVMNLKIGEGENARSISMAGLPEYLPEAFAEQEYGFCRSADGYWEPIWVAEKRAIRRRLEAEEAARAEWAETKVELAKIQAVTDDPSPPGSHLKLVP